MKFLSAGLPARLAAGPVDRKPRARQATAVRFIPILAGLSTLGGCATAPAPVPQVVPTRSVPMRPVGLERVLGQDARGLVALFGDANQDIREEGARRLQYTGPFCILDAYLYPPKTGGEPVVTYVDARQPDGRDIDRASCVAALTRRREAR